MRSVLKKFGEVLTKIQFFMNYKVDKVTYFLYICFIEKITLKVLKCIVFGNNYFDSTDCKRKYLNTYLSSFCVRLDYSEYVFD